MACELVDDFVADNDEHNDLSFLFMLKVEYGARVRLYPTVIEDLGIRLANEQERGYLLRTLQAKCKAFGTTVQVEESVATIVVNVPS